MKLLDFTKANPGRTRWTDLDRWVEANGYMSLTATPTYREGHNSSGAEVDIGNHTEAWLTYKVWFRNEHIFGRNEKAHSVGGKMPGLASSGPHDRMNGNYTGGNHSDDGFSARLMWRGHNSKGNSWEPADGFAIGLYSYDYELARRDDLTYGRSLLFRKPTSNEVNPFAWEDADGNNGRGPGQIGDTDVWTVPTGEWITITLGHGVGLAAEENWFEAWVSTESEPEPWRALYLDGRTSDFRWMAPTAEQKIDTFLFQSYWGGKGDIWLPDRNAELRYKDISVHDARSINDSDPIDNANGVQTGLGGEMAVTVHGYGDTGSEELELSVDGHVCPRRFILEQDMMSFTWTGIPRSTDIVLRFVNDGDDAMNRDRNIYVDSIDVGGLGATLLNVRGNNERVVSTGTFPYCGDELTGGSGWLHCDGELRFANALLALLPAPPDPPVAPPMVEEVERICEILRSFAPAAQMNLLGKVLVKLADTP